MTFRILIIEGKPKVRDALKRALADQGYELEEEPGAPPTLARLEEYRLHVIICDVFIPGGIIPFLETVQQLADPPLVIVIASAASREAAIQALRAGAHDYIVTPLTMEEVSTRVGRAVERKRSLEEMHLQLIQSDRMASLGRLVAGVAHEINTPVGAIYSSSDSLTRLLAKLRDSVESIPACAGQQDIRGFVEVLANIAEVDRIACERIADIVKNLKTFARLDEAETKEVDIHEGLESTLRLVQCDFKDRIRVEKDYHDIPLIQCHPNQLNQVFLNLLVNAVEAIEGEGLIRISTQSRDGHVVITISDTGKGIATDDIPNIFDPGFTTKGVGVGTGLGLSIVYKIIQAHKGTITAESELGKGTKFVITLPVR